MTMRSIQITLPDPLKSSLDERVALGEFGTPGEYVRDLIRRDKESRSAYLEAEFADALSTPVLEISTHELESRNLVSILRSRVAKQ